MGGKEGRRIEGRMRGERREGEGRGGEGEEGRREGRDGIRLKDHNYVNIHMYM